MVIVARDGSGDFTSLQAAIDAIPEPGRAPAIILLRMDEYRERAVVHRNNVRIIGEARDRTVLAGSGGAKDPFSSAALTITGNNVEIENLTVRSDAGDGADPAAGLAAAVCAAGDRGVFRNCRLIGPKNALRCGPLREAEPGAEAGPLTRSRQYFERCRVEGDVDCIRGSCCWFEACTLHTGARGGRHTAANPHRRQPFGLVFHRCRLTGEGAPGAADPDRPGQAFVRTAFLECEMDGHGAPEGCADRDGEARTITLPEVLSGYDGWRPDRRIPTWFLCGDSTMADYPEEQSPMMGWGQALQALLPENVFVVNEAVCGRSSKSFVAEKRLSMIELCLRPGDRLLISFSHNDEKEDPLRYTSPRLTYPEYLGMYIDAARQQGAEPVLITPVARRLFDEAGRPVPTHGEYPAAMRDLAAYRGVRLVDLEAATMALLQETGPEGSKALFCHVPAGSVNYPDGLQDNSHLQDRGAIRVAAIFLDLLQGKRRADAVIARGDPLSAARRAAIAALEDSILR